MASPFSCDATGVPFTLLGALITAGPAAWPACVGGGRAFLRDYARRGTNALLWAGLLAVTWILLLRLAALLRLWALGSRIPGPRALLADPGLAAVLRNGGDITGWWPLLSPPYSLFMLTEFGSVGWVQLAWWSVWDWDLARARPLHLGEKNPYSMFELLGAYVPLGYCSIEDWM